MIETMKVTIRDLIEETYPGSDVTVEEPKRGNADLAVPLFQLARNQNMNPMAVFASLEDGVRSLGGIMDVTFTNGFMNITLDRGKTGLSVINAILSEGEAFGSSEAGQGKTVVIDYSSPNIAKSFSVGHLRSTMIGNALANLYRMTGHRVVGINHLGDWGTQFGKMIVAYSMWGDDDAIRKDPIQTLQSLYVRFHDAAEKDPTLEDMARLALLRLEQGDPEHVRLWQWFKDESLKDFMRMYDILGVSFDSYDGESFYNDKMDAVVEELASKGLLKIDDGATIVDLGEDMPPALIKRSDGGTLYITRDLAALFYRKKTYGFDKILYVVGNEQQLHFRQLQAVSSLMGYDIDIEHINFGLVLIDGKKMSTRSGQFKRLEDVIDLARTYALEAITEKNPSLSDKESIAKAVAIGAIIFNDLKNERHLDVDFNLDAMLKFEGMTGPYIQYSGVRIASMLKERTVTAGDADPAILAEDHYFEIVKLLDRFPTTVLKATQNNAVNMVARHLLQIAQGFNSFYARQKVLVDDPIRLKTNLAFIKAVRTVLDNGLSLLGIQPLEEM
jgi:arginyl-tRNA synthetase